MPDAPRLEGKVEAVSLSPVHSFSKANVAGIRLLKGLGVEGDAHMGETVKHRSRVKANPLTPNYRQVHLIQCELFDELAAHGFALTPGEIGENIATRGLDLLALPTASRLKIGQERPDRDHRPAQSLPPDRRLQERTAETCRQQGRGRADRTAGRNHGGGAWRVAMSGPET